MPSGPTIEPPAAKKRGRPKKVVTEDAGTAPTAKTSKVVVKKVAAKPSGKAKTVEDKKEKKTVTKSAKTVTATAASGKKDAPQSTLAPEQPTPVTPSTSKILEEVQAKGTLKAAQSAKPVENTTVIKKPATPQPQPQPQEPASKPAPSQSKPPPPPPPPSTKPAPPPPKPSRPTTIPLPTNPSKAPSPIQQPPPPNPYPRFAKPSPGTRHIPPNPYPSSLRPSQPPSPPHRQQHPTRIIEPTPNIRLPPKYKPAARRVTAIMVALPIVMVFGYELFERWRGKEVQRKFGDGMEGVKDRERERDG